MHQSSMCKVAQVARLAGKVALVTGASSGIGEATISESTLLSRCCDRSQLISIQVDKCLAGAPHKTA
jgi:hypothetical protein